MVLSGFEPIYENETALLGIEGAQLIARLVYASLHGKTQNTSTIAIAEAGLQVCQSDRFTVQRHRVIAWLKTSEDRKTPFIDPVEIRHNLGNGMAAL